MAVSGQDIGLIFGLAGGGTLGGATGSHIRSQLATLVENLNNNTQVNQRKLKFSLDTAGTRKNFSDGLKQITSGLSEQKQFKIKLAKIDATAAIKDFQSKIQGVLNTLQVKNGMTVSVKDFNSGGKITGDPGGAKSLSEASARAEEYAAQLRTIKNLTTALSGAEGRLFKIDGADAQTVTDLSNRIQALQGRIEAFKNAKNQPNQGFVNETIAETEALKAEVDALVSSTRATENANSVESAANVNRERSVQELTSLEGLLQQVEHAQTGWTKAAGDPRTREAFESLAPLAERIRGAMAGLNNESLSNLRREFKSTETVIKGTGNATQSTFDRLGGLAGKFSTWFSLTRVIMGAFRAVKQMVSATIELDSAMTQLKIVTRDTDQAYKDYLTSISATAKRIGSSITDLVDSTTVYARLGYSLDEASKLAEYTAMLQNVGDIDVADAQNAVTAIVKAYGKGVDELEDVMDKMVVVGNNFPISVSQLAEGMNNAGSALSAAGNSFEQSLALLAAANTTVQNISKSSTGLRTIAARIRNTKTELDDMGESMTDAEYQKIVSALTRYNVALTDSNNEFRSTYEIMNDIAGVWSTMSKTEQAALAETMSGTRQQNIFYSLINQFQEASGAMDAMGDSAGALTDAYDTYMTGVKGHIGQFKAAFQELGSTLIDTGFINEFIDLGTAVLNILTGVASLIQAIGGLNTVLTTTVGLVLAFKLPSILAVIKSVKLSLFDSSVVRGFQAIHAGLVSITTGSKAAASAFTMLGGAASVASAAIAALTLVIGIGMAAYSHFQQVQEENRQKMDEAAKKANEERESLQALTKEYHRLASADTIDETSRDRIQQIQKEITDLVGTQADNLDLVNGKLDDEIEKLEQISVANAYKNIGSLQEKYNETNAVVNHKYDAWTDTLNYNLDDFKHAAGGLNSGLPRSLTADELAKQFGINPKWFVNTSGGFGTWNLNMDGKNIREQLAVLKDLHAELVSTMGRWDAWTMDATDSSLTVGESMTRGLSELEVGIQTLEGLISEADTASKNYFSSKAIIDFSEYRTKNDIDTQEQFDSYIDGIRDSAEYSRDYKDALIDVAARAFPEFAKAAGIATDAANKLSGAISGITADADTKRQVDRIRELAREYNAITNGNVDYGKRPFVSPEKMRNVYPEFDGDIATTYSQSHTFGNAEALYTVEVTPILEDGTVLSQDALDEYVSNLVADSGIDGVLASDTSKLILNIQPGDYDEDYWGDYQERIAAVKNAHWELVEQLRSTTGLTLDEIQGVLSGVLSLEEGLALAAERATQLKGSITDIDAAKEELDKVGKVLGEFRENGQVGADAFEPLLEKFGNLNSFQNFVDIMSSSSSTMEQAQAAADTLGTEWVNQIGILRNLNDENAMAVTAMLQMIGVTNAEAVVQGQLAMQKYLALMATQDFTDATAREAAQLLVDCGAAQSLDEALDKVRKAHDDATNAAEFFNTATAEQIGLLYAQAKAAGLSSKALSALTNLQDLNNRLASNPKAYLTVDNAKLRDQWIADAQDAIALLDAGIKVPEIKVSVPKISTGGKNGASTADKTSAKEVERYIADIDRLRKRKELLRREELENTRISDRIAKTDDSIGGIKERIRLTNDLIAGYEEEQRQLHNLAGHNNGTADNPQYEQDTRRAMILEKINEFESKYGIQVQYNAETNELLCDGLEEINNLEADRSKAYETDAERQEAQNKRIKEAETLYGEIVDLNNENIECSAQWEENAGKIHEEHQKIVDDLKKIVEVASSVVDEVQGVYDTLQKAADEYAANDGFISVDTFQEITANGLQYMQLLTNENGLLEINRERINNVIKARTEQMALEAAWSYARRIEEAAEAAARGDQGESLDMLTQAQDANTASTWNAIAAKLEYLRINGKISEDQYQGAIQNVQYYRTILTGVRADFNQHAEDMTAANEAMDKILEYTIELVKQQVQDEIDGLNELVDQYNRLIDAKKEALDKTKEEDDYADEMLEKTKKLAKLRTDAGLLRLAADSGDRSAEAKLAKNLEEQSELQKEIDEQQRDHAIETQKEALDKMADNYKEQKDGEIEELERSISSQQKLYDKAITYIDEHWDTLYADLLAWNTEYGSTINDEITQNWVLATNALEEYKKSCEGVGTFSDVIRKRNADQYGTYDVTINKDKTSTVTQTSQTQNDTVADTALSSYGITQGDRNKISTAVSRMRVRANRWHDLHKKEENGTITADEAQELSDVVTYNQNEVNGGTIGENAVSDGLNNMYPGLGITFNNGLWQLKDGRELFKVFHTGGIVGGGTPRENEQMAVLQNGEPIISNAHKQDLFDLVDFAAMLSNRLGNINPAGLDLVSPARNGGLMERLVESSAQSTPSIHFGDVYIYGGNDETVRKHKEVSREFANEVLKYLRIKP